jgi:hypothetical protein
LQALLAAALVGVLHVHHAPSHDSEAPFEEVVEAAHDAGLDFVVLAEHADPEVDAGPLPAAERAGRYPGPDGRELLVLVGVELGTADGHLLAYDVPELLPATERPGRDVIADVHRLGGFAVVPHPFAYGGWTDWDAPFDGLEVHNNAAAFRQTIGPFFPFRLFWYGVSPDSVLRGMLERPDRELERWDRLLAEGRPIFAYSGADVHRNTSILGWQLDPYERMFRAVRTHCPGALEPRALWDALRGGRCTIRYALYEDRAGEAELVRFPSGREELQLSGGAVLEIRNPIIEAP